MKLPIKKKYFDLIKSGKKQYEYRDAHITFVCEETGETIRREIETVYIEPHSWLGEEGKKLKAEGCIEDEEIIIFELCKNSDDGNM